MAIMTKEELLELVDAITLDEDELDELNDMFITHEDAVIEALFKGRPELANAVTGVKVRMTEISADVDDDETGGFLSFGLSVRLETADLAKLFDIVSTAVETDNNE